MITLKEEIVVTQDDEMLSEYKRVFTEKDGWRVKETTVSVVFERVQFLGVGVMSGIQGINGSK